MIASSVGGAQPNISQKIIRNLEIPLPPIEMQEQIVAEIEVVRREIEEYRNKIENCEQKIKDKINDVWGE